MADRFAFPLLVGYMHRMQDGFPAGKKEYMLPVTRKK